MRVRRCVVVPVFGILLVAGCFAQTTPKREASAVTILARAMSASGPQPADVQATGTVTLTEGSRTETGTIRIVGRGLEETAEHMVLPSGRRSLVFSKGAAHEKNDDVVSKKSVESAASSQSPSLPVLFILSALTDPDISAEYIGLETLDGADAHHLRLTNTFSSKKSLERFSEFTKRDIWIDATTSLPKKVWYEQRSGSGAVPRIACGAIYSDYRSVNGRLLPFRIERFQNGSPWATIQIEKYSLNAGIGKSEFDIQ